MLMPQYSWNIAKVGIQHQSINQSINADVAAKFFITVDYKNYKGTAILFHINDFYIKKKHSF